ncbi:MAG: signal peptidase I [Alistipes sp.]|jgi:signal peptidase I|nr:signal peptidase I [Alistipes sp.]MBQ5785575.1 signal peptidase I [Alistipes sp.]MEE1102861.1 signal peptidase I [Alistipes sp.]
MKLKEKILQNKYVVMLKEFFGNKWVKFTLATIVYVLWFVVWTGNLWLLPGIIVIYDLYISKYFYKYVWSKNEKLCEISSLYRNIYEWGNAIVFATVVATLIHIFFFQMYVIPSSSMEKSLLVGDYLYVSKVTYGPQMPNTPVAFPFVHHTMPFSQTKKSFSEAIKLPYKRLKGLRQIERNDVVVFNFPAGDTVLVENQAVTYYDVLRDYQEQYGKQKGRELLEKQYNIVYRPVDKRENYIKRCVALPGDSIKIVDGELFINGKVQDKVVEKQYCYSINTSEPLSQYAIDELGITEISGSGNNYFSPLTDQMVERLLKMKNVKSVTRYIATDESFPHDPHYKWTADNMGSLWIPKKGATITLTQENLPLYERIIDVYEDNDLEVKNGEIFINGEKAESYTFKMDYYWMMGDNRHNSADSRYWGFVPEDHIVGKASFIWMSADQRGSFPTNIRWNRLFNKVK